MKCLNCGSEEFFKISILKGSILGGYGDIQQSIDTYACKNCGRVELFAPQEMIDKQIEKENKKLEEEKLKKECIQKIEKLKKKITDLELIVKDENQTVKAVKQAQEELAKKQKELKVYVEFLNGKRSNLTMPRHIDWGGK